MYLWRNPREVFEMAADPVGLLNNGVHAQLGDLVDERVLVAFPVLHHCGQQRESSVHWPYQTDENHQAVGFVFFFPYRGLSCVCTH